MCDGRPGLPARCNSVGGVGAKQSFPRGHDDHGPPSCNFSVLPICNSPAQLQVVASTSSLSPPIERRQQIPAPVKVNVTKHESPPGRSRWNGIGKQNEAGYLERSSAASICTSSAADAWAGTNSRSVGACRRGASSVYPERGSTAKPSIARSVRTIKMVLRGMARPTIPTTFTIFRLARP